jgi:hypothetical protein
VVRAVAAIGTLPRLCLVALPSVLRLPMPLPDAARIVLSMAWMAPLAFAMGIPFPTGLARHARRGAEGAALIPWAWGINACASVVAAILSTLLAIHLGFVVVVASAVALYATARMKWP